jgi:16S rRNA (uracil1498-N3)-methyltransferase
MTTHRFFVRPEDLAGDAFPVPSQIARQVTRVLRLHDGEELVLLDDAGAAVRCRLADGGTSLQVVARESAAGEPRHRLTIAQAILKGDGLERVIQQGTELGVSEFRLLVTRRGIVRDLSERRMARLRAIARESAEQSERGRVPAVRDPEPFEAALAPGAILLHERAVETAPRLGALDPPGTLIVGPEGGFDPEEVRAALTAGTGIASLGPRILRAESVAVAAAAIVLSRSGDFA